MLTRAAGRAGMRRHVARTASRGLATSFVERVHLNTGRELRVEWEDGTSSRYNATWLQHNAPEHTQGDNGQKLAAAFEHMGDELVSAAISDDGHAVLTSWRDKRTPLRFPLAWLRLNDPSGQFAEARASVGAAWVQWPHQDGPPTIDFDEVMEDDAGLLRWLSVLNVFGMCLVTNAPAETGHVDRLGRRVAYLQQNLYGDVFDVMPTDDPVNVAYSTVHIPLHTDLAYYESPPGLQLLHCVTFDDAIKGGESTLLDTFPLMQAVRAREPEVYEALSTIPASFQKAHLRRAHPAQYLSRKPHVQVSTEGDVVGVSWAPAFEGPVQGNAETIERYYAAYRRMFELFEGGGYDGSMKLQFRLKPGEVLTFNQRRVLHGRNEFANTGSGRHLQGCYINVDEYANRLRFLLRQQAQGLLGSTGRNQPLTEAGGVAAAASELTAQAVTQRASAPGTCAEFLARCHRDLCVAEAAGANAWLAESPPLITRVANSSLV